MSLKIEVIGMSRLKNALDDYVVRKKNAIVGVVAQTSSDVQSKARQLAPSDSGTLKQEITYTVMEKKDKIVGEVLSGATYSAAVEFGSKPHWTSVKNLKGWAQRHGVNPYALQNKIALYGTSTKSPTKGPVGQPFMVPAAKAVRPRFYRLMRIVMGSP